MLRTGRTALVEQFIADGFTHMFGNPGTVEQGFLDTIEDFPGLQYVLALQETVAIGIADGYARASGGPALVQLHSGVGLGNGIGMLYQAKRGHAPLVVIAGEAGVRYDAMDAQMASDLVAMARPVTKYATRVLHPESLLRVLRRAVKIAVTPPAGPVFVALPMDVLDAANDEDVRPTVVPSTRVQPEPALVARAAALLAGARRPVVLAGDGVAASGAQAELVLVAETLGADVWLVDSSEPNMPAGHPLMRGPLGHMFGQASTRSLADADAVLVVGTYLFPEVFPDLSSPFAEGTPVVHIDLDAYEIGKNHAVDLGLVADPRLTLAALAPELGRQLGPDGTARAAARRDVRRAGAGRAAAPAPDEDSAFAEFLRQVAARTGGDVMVFDEALTASPLVQRHLPPVRPGHNLVTRGGSLGVGLPGAVGMKIAHPDHTVIGFTGDGGAMYTYQALWTAVRHDVAARFVVCNNHRYELLNQNIDEYWRERGDVVDRAHPSSFDLSRPEIDFVGLARAMGADGATVRKKDDVTAAVEAMFAAPGPFLVDLCTDDLLRP